jgi:hypothetical protein
VYVSWSSFTDPAFIFELFKHTANVPDCTVRLTGSRLSRLYGTELHPKQVNKILNINTWKVFILWKLQEEFPNVAIVSTEFSSINTSLFIESWFC